MHLSHLSLKDFRNFDQLDLTLGPGLFLFQGENAQGKTNLLEAVAMLATSNSFHASSDREIVNWHTSEHVTRIVAAVERHDVDLNVEIVIFDPTQQEKGSSAEREFQFIPPNERQRKRIKINGVPKRAIDLIGQVTVVLFSPNDLSLVDGYPEVSKDRYAAICLAQAHP